MEFMISVPLLLDISGYSILAAMFTYRARKISVRPELPSPELLLNLRATLEDLPCRNALDGRDYLCNAVPWNGLHEEMHVVLVRADLKEFHLISVLNLYTYFFHHCIHVLVKYGTSVFCGKNQMIYEHRNVMALVYIFAHIKILRRKRRGIQPVEI